MNALRNVSSQSLIVQKPSGGNTHLLPGRAVTLSDEELTSPQVLQLLKSGFAQIEKLGKPEGVATGAEKEEKRSEKKKAEH
jgi:hypothetical protein